MRKEKKERRNELLIAIGHRINEARRKLGISLEDFGIESLADPPTVSRIEKGETKPSIDFLCSLVSEFRINVNYILIGEGSIFIENTEKRGKN